MSSAKSSQWYRKAGGPFQLLMIGSWMAKVALTKLEENAFLPSVFGVMGIMLFSYCLLHIYLCKSNGLLTTGVFKYTRHPMYTGALLFAVHIWWSTQPRNTLYYTTLGLFLIGLIVAAYLQEKETLARYGKEAEDYYAKTPRLFVFYPIRWFLFNN